MPCWPFSPFLYSLLVIGLLELLEGILQVSDLCLLLIQHHDKTWVELPLQHLLILNLLLQPDEKKKARTPLCVQKSICKPLDCFTRMHMHKQTNLKRTHVCLSSESNLLRIMILMHPHCTNIRNKQAEWKFYQICYLKRSPRDIKWIYKWITWNEFTEIIGLVCKTGWNPLK